MAELPSALLKARHLSALDAVQAELMGDSTYRMVSADEGAPLLRHCPVIWRRQISASGRERTVDVGLPPYFPDEPPLACVIEWEDLEFRNPHISSGGFLCVIPDSASIDSGDPVGLVAYVFDGAEAVLNGTNANEFRDEFSAYWGRKATDDAQSVVIIEPVSKLGNTFPIIFMEDVIFIASSVEKINQWLTNWLDKPFKLQAENLGIVIHLDAPLLPQEYPNSVADLLSLSDAHDAVAAHALKAYVTKNYDRGLALLLQKDGDSFALGAITFSGLGLSHIRTRDLNRGFRPGKIPQGVLLQRSVKRTTSTKIERHIVSRVDRDYIHARGGDGRDLSEKSVLIIGCGSLGGYVSHLLGRSGIGRMTLIDKEKLTWENLGRHILGASASGEWKAEALAKELTKQMPHLKIDGIAKDWRRYLAEELELFSQYDLVLSTVADWRCEAPLNTLTRQTQMPLVLFGWLEPYAVAGHCLVLGSQGGCFQCATNALGQFNQNVSTFGGATLSKEPGGCTYYQKYGPIALMPVASLIASSAVDSLLSNSAESSLNTWVSSEEHMKTVGASVSPIWIPEINKTGYSRNFHKSWKSSDSCVLCS